jgi:hypothetical protein
VKLPAHSSRAPSKTTSKFFALAKLHDSKGITSARTMVRSQNLEPGPDPKSSHESKAGRIQAVDFVSLKAQLLPLKSESSVEW